MVEVAGTGRTVTDTTQNATGVDPEGTGASG